MVDIVQSAELISGRLRNALQIVYRNMTVVLSLPTLPFPPAFTTRPAAEWGV